ncbi:hypothetical protein Vafri_6149, partial [Volvox africanus]
MLPRPLSTDPRATNCRKLSSRSAESLLQLPLLTRKTLTYWLPLLPPPPPTADGHPVAAPPSVAQAWNPSASPSPPPLAFLSPPPGSVRLPIKAVAGLLQTSETAVRFPTSGRSVSSMSCSGGSATVPAFATVTSLGPLTGAPVPTKPSSPFSTSPLTFRHPLSPSFGTIAAKS